jgi:prevent-host-death family protein
MERVEVGIRELRLNLSRYVARVREGAEVIVTDHGEPVARLGPLEEEEDTFARLVSEGLVIPGSRPSGRTMPPLIDEADVSGAVSVLVLDDRE